MGSVTKIEWCDSTWNPVTGCLHGCTYCYARRIAERFGARGRAETSAFHAVHPCAGGWRLHVLDYPLSRIAREPRPAGAVGWPATPGRGKDPYPFGFDPTLYRYRLGQPGKWKEPRTVFVCPMADLFGRWVPDEWIREVFDACDAAPQHRYVFLTKNPNRYIDLAKKGMLPQEHWYGYTANRQSDLWEFEHAGDCPAKNLFVSVEPILEPIELRISTHVPMDWVIVGAETGNRKGKVTPEKEWIQGIMEECYYSVTPLFMKDSLTSIIAEKDMYREFPWDFKRGGEYDDAMASRERGGYGRWEEGKGDGRNEV